MLRRFARMIALVALGLVVIVLISVTAFAVYDQRTLTAQALATPQVQPTTAAGSGRALEMGLPPELNVATVHLLNGRTDVFVLDVRSPGEYDAGHIPGATLIPLNQLAGRLDEVPRVQAVIVACATGHRSVQAADGLRAEGLAHVHNMIGGLRAWNKAGYPVER